MDESTDFFLLGSATYPPPPRPHCTFESRGILRGKKRFVDECTDFRGTSRAPNELFGYYPKSQDFSEFRLGNPASGHESWKVIQSKRHLPLCENSCSGIPHEEKHERI